MIDVHQYRWRLRKSIRKDCIMEQFTKMRQQHHQTLFNANKLNHNQLYSHQQLTNLIRLNLNNYHNKHNTNAKLTQSSNLNIQTSLHNQQLQIPDINDVKMVRMFTMSTIQLLMHLQPSPKHIHHFNIIQIYAIYIKHLQKIYYMQIEVIWVILTLLSCKDNLIEFIRQQDGVNFLLKWSLINDKIRNQCYGYLQDSLSIACIQQIIVTNHLVQQVIMYQYFDSRNDCIVSLWKSLLSKINQEQCQLLVVYGIVDILIQNQTIQLLHIFIVRCKKLLGESHQIVTVCQISLKNYLESQSCIFQ